VSTQYDDQHDRTQAKNEGTILFMIVAMVISVMTATSEQLTGEEEFNKGFILPTLIIQLRKILDQYPDDIQILKVSLSVLISR